MLHLALDPNVCIAASHNHPHSSGLLEDIKEVRDYIRLVADDEGTILGEYEHLAEVLPEVQRKWLSWVLENKDALLRELPIPGFSTQEPTLCDIGCGTPVEPQLVSLSWEYGKMIKLLVVGAKFRHGDLRARGVHSKAIVSHLQHNLEIDIVVWDALHARRAIADHIKHEPLYPHDECELDDFLKENGYEENDQLEFKQPNNEDRSKGFYLTRSILKDTMREICGLANSHGGRVILGIAEDKKHIGVKEGFVLEYQSKKGIRPKNVEQIFNILATDDHLFSDFDPPIGPYLRCHLFPLSNGRYVLVFHVQKTDFDCYYGSKLHCRYGRQTKFVKRRD